MNRPHTTLSLLQSIDGNTATSMKDYTAFTKILSSHSKLRDGMSQIYAELKTIDWEFISGKMAVRNRANEKNFLYPFENKVSRIILGLNNLTSIGVRHIVENSAQVILIASQASNVDSLLNIENLRIFRVPSINDLKDVLSTLYDYYNIKNLSLQIDEELVEQFIYYGLLDQLTVFITPLIVGNNNKPGGKDFYNYIRNYVHLEFISLTALKDGFIKADYALT